VVDDEPLGTPVAEEEPLGTPVVEEEALADVSPVVEEEPQATSRNPVTYAPTSAGGGFETLAGARSSTTGRGHQPTGG
jgi:hypothetical protein